ncbi:MAG: nicotinate phosphoribosyltransferase [Opitutales bacterium]
MISSLLDTDWYKLTMRQAVEAAWPGTTARYRLFLRGTEQPVESAFENQFQAGIEALADLKLTEDEAAWLRAETDLPDDAVTSLKAFRFQPEQVEMAVDEEGRITLDITGPWTDTILWEVPVLAVLTELYYREVARDWSVDLDAYRQRSADKARRLSEAGCRFAEFGTRRRRSLAIQEACLAGLMDGSGDQALTGTSNVDQARRNGLKPIGTIAHEWVMAHAGLVSVAEANPAAFSRWIEVSPTRPRIALTDTYTVDLFCATMRPGLTAAYDGFRHDSGDPFAFADRIIGWLEGQGIDPAARMLVFSDSVTVDRAIQIQRHVDGRCGVSFGIGGHFTHDFNHPPRLDPVIKLVEINGTPVAKTTDEPDKATGHPDSLESTRAAVSAALQHYER